jgi:catechol 2,3-dioxygenase-like lactoylglutathione lyase family enzyme
MDTLHKIDHVAINVADLDKSIHWYQSSFTCELVARDKTQAVLQFSNIRLVLVLPSLEPTHLAYEREDAQTLGELRDRPHNVRSTFVADPTGNVVEIMVPRLVESSITT